MTVVPCAAGSSAGRSLIIRVFPQLVRSGDDGLSAFPGFLSAAYREVSGTCNRCSGKTFVFAGRHRFIERLADSNNIMKTPVVIISGVMKHADRLTDRIMT